MLQKREQAPKCGSNEEEKKNPSSRTVTLGSIQPLREMSIRNLPEGKERPARKTDNLTAICELIV
jgi:hypothetical protein